MSTDDGLLEALKTARLILSPKMSPNVCEIVDRALKEADEAQGRWRPEVRAFADLMEAKLRENDHKPGWKADRPEALLRRLGEEVDELVSAIYSARLHDTSDRGTRLTPARVLAAAARREAPDVANFAMMIADVCGALALTDAGRAALEQGS